MRALLLVGLGLFPVYGCSVSPGGTQNQNQNDNSSTAPTTHVVLVGQPEDRFSPQDLTIRAGDTVQWEWVAELHTVTAGTVDDSEPEIFRSGEPTDVVGTLFEVTFDQDFLDENPKENNIYDYHCEIHGGEGMVGTITVAAD